MGPSSRRRGRAKRADPRSYLGAVVLLASAGLIVLPGVSDATLAVLRPVALGETACRIYRVTDGDTVRMWCSGRGNVSVRLTGFDAPELFSPRCAGELAAAVRAKWALRHAIWGANEVALRHEGTDRYGRTLVAAFIDGAPLARRMIDGGHARQYDGGARQGWCR